MKWIKRGAVAVLALALIGGAVFWNKIQDIRALVAYSAIFEPDTIDENFRSLHKNYPSVTIKRSGPVAEFQRADRGEVIPATYEYEGKTLDTKDVFEEIHWTGLVVLHDGNVVHEDYARGNSGDNLHIEMSVTKSLTSILVGIAYDQGHLPNLDAQVTDFVPELKDTGYDGVTVQQVLDMTSGIRYVEDYDDLNSDIVQTVVATLRGSLDEFATTMVREREPGTFNQYASIETQVLAWILRRATGQDYADFFQHHLWSKIGAEADGEMLVDSVGEPMAYGGANLRLRDLARVGQMVLSGGVAMTGERVVSEAWLRQSVMTDTEQSKPGEHEKTDFILGYKNQWWIPTNRDGNEFSAIGIYGQFLYINPQRGVVIAMNSAYPEYNENVDTELQMLSAFRAISKNLSPDK